MSMKLCKVLFSTKKTFVKNIFLPVCIECVHFIKYTPTTHIYENTISRFSQCKMFGVKDLIDGKIKYDFASFTREDNSKCGEKGVFFVAKQI